MPKSLKDEFPTISDIAYRDYLKHSHVSDVMTSTVLTISPEASMMQGAKIMGERHVGSLIVTEKDTPTGIVTERDLLSKIVAADKDPASVKVKDVMSVNLISINPIDTIKEAAQTMISQKGRLVVFKEGRVVGIITASDLIKTLPKTSEKIIVDDIMTKKVESVDREITVEKVAKMMGKMRIGSVLVNDSGKPFGIFTERDLLTKVLARGLSMESGIGELSSTPLITLPSESNIHKVALTMVAKHVRRIPITQNGDIIGIVTARDLVEAYSK